MRFSALFATAAIIALFAFTGSRAPETAEVTLTLTEAGNSVSGMVKITNAAGETVKPPELFSRGKGLSNKLPIDDWYVVLGKTKLRLPRGQLTIEAFSGLETETTRTTVDVGKTNTIDIPLTRFSNSRKQGLRSANTHLHLQKISREECDRYLTEIPQADDLDVLFLSYLERAVADKQYTSNRYTTADLAKLTKASGVLFGNGEEHRHNFTGFGQGYGHVMLLNIKKLIQPVSIGPGIMKIGTDGLPLQRGIDTARRDGATVVWCHNDWGMEQVPNWVTGRVNAHNIFDGGTHGSFKNSFYRYLNAGIRVPFSTGTDWFMYDFSRVYVPIKGKLTVKKWLAALSAGKSYVTNGPLMEFTINGKSIGETVTLKQAGPVKVVGKIVGRIDFGRVELVRNGVVIAKADTKKVGRHYEAELKSTVPLNASAWLCLRTPPPPVPDDPKLSESVAKNEFDQWIFAHTSAVHVEIAGRRYFDVDVANELLAYMQTSRKTILDRATFADEQEKARVVDVYSDAITEMKRKIAAAR